MLDQASELRERMLALRPVANGQARAARRILVCGAAARIGASSIAANLAVELAGRSKSTALVDGAAVLKTGASDDSVAAARLCRVAGDWLQPADSPLDDAPAYSRSQRGAAGVLVASPADVAAWLPRGHVPSRSSFDSESPEIAVDYQLLDAGEGLGSFAQSSVAWADECIVVSRCDDAAVMQAYAVVKQFVAAIARTASAPVAGLPAIWLVVNQAPDAETADDVFARFGRGCQRFLSVAPRLLGWLPDDSTVADAAQCGSPFVLLSPRCAAARAIGAMATELNNTTVGGGRSEKLYASLPHERSESPVAVRS
jgi:flagellar biosynthesis protein FlhG